MNTNQVSIEQAIALVENQLGSVFTKEDVINLMNRIELPKPVIATELTPELKIQVLNEYESIIKRHVNRNCDEDIVDMESAEFSIGYRNQIELDSICIDNDKIEYIIQGAFEEVITGLEDEIYERDKQKEEIEAPTAEEIMQAVETITNTHDLQIEAQHDTFSEAREGQVEESK
jgi:uncharacterized protein (UPF0254 family)